MFGKKTSARLKWTSRTRLTAANVRAYLGRKYLSVDEKTTIDKIEQPDDVAEYESGDEGSAGLIIDGEIVAVLSFSKYSSCINCGTKVQCEAVVVECGSCGTKMKSPRRKKTQMARVVVQSDDDGKVWRWTIFEDILSEMIGTTDVEDNLDDKLLSAPRYKFTVKNNTVCAVIEF